MSDADKPSHLIERAAERLAALGQSGLQSIGALPQSDLLKPAPSAPRPMEALPATAQTGTANDVADAMPPNASVPPAEAAPDTMANFINMGTLISAGLVVSGTNRTRISEEYRIAVSRILRATRKTKGPSQAGELIMVTSARPGEGKSFTALNIAGAIAHNVMRPTVLVDVDFKKRSVTHLLRLSDRKGLLDVASTGRVQIENLIVPTAVDHLSVLPVGRDAGDIDSGLDRRPVAQVIEHLAARFPDYIFILDLPPCLSTSDPSTLAPVVNEAIVVVEAERTQRSEVEAALDLIKLCPKITVLLNKIRTTRRNTFGAYDYYGSYS